jgi:hypothetical protein
MKLEVIIGDAGRFLFSFHYVQEDTLSLLVVSMLMFMLTRLFRGFYFLKINFGNIRKNYLPSLLFNKYLIFNYSYGPFPVPSLSGYLSITFKSKLHNTTIVP